VWLVVLLLAIIVCLAGVIRLRLVDLPLERDEGEYAYAGQLMLQGIPPYKLAYNMKLPGTYAAYAVIMAVFGQTTRGIHLGLIATNGITIVLVYFLGRRLFGQVCGLTAAAAYALMTLSDSVLGLAAHATHFVTLFAMAGMLLLLNSARTDRALPVFWSGVSFGLAFVMKQPGVFFGIFGGLVILWHELRRRPFLVRRLLARLSIFSIGAVVPIAVVVGVLSVAGVFHQFWFWTFDYAGQYVGHLTIFQGWEEFKVIASRIITHSAGIWVLTAAGLVVSLVGKRTRSAGLMALAFLVASFAAACPGYYFRRHYFIPLLPAAAVFAGAGIEAIWQLVPPKWLPKVWLTGAMLVALLIAFGQTVHRHRRLFFQLSPNEASWALYGRPNPFPEAVAIGDYVREHSKPDARVVVVGSEPEIYFYSQRHSATGFIYMYPLMETQKYAVEMQRQAIQEIEQAKPDFLVFVAVPWSWMQRESSSTEIMEWAQKYIQTDFDQVGLIDIQAEQSVYRWGEQAVAAIPRSPYYLRIFKRLDFSY